MSHRILLVGGDPRVIAPLEASLRRHGQSVISASDAQPAAALARQFLPSVIVLITPLHEQLARDWLAVLIMHRATAALPVVVVTPAPTADAAIGAFSSGVVDILEQHSKPEQLVARLDATLGSAHDAARRAAAIDRRGGAVLRRVGAYLRSQGFSGVLHVDAAGDEATVSFAAGAVVDTRYGDLRGDGALRALLSHPGDAVWGMRFVRDRSDAAAPAASVDEVFVDVADDDGALELADVAEEAADAPPLAGPPPRLLLVDDDPALIELYGRFLTRAGFHVATEPNGKRGYATAAKLRPDVILSDIMMPETDGWGFLTLLRDDYRLRETPFLLLSCHHDFVEKLRDLEVGADDYLAKGLRGDAVVARVTAAVMPRRRMLAALSVTEPFKGALGQVGIQTLLTALGEKGATGTLHVDDGLVKYAVGLKGGRVVSTSAASNDRRERGNDVLLSLLTLEDAPFRFDPGDVPAEDSGPRFGEMREALASELNALRDRTRDKLMAADSSLVFDARVLAFYRVVCPEVVRTIIEQLRGGAAPREVMASGVSSPIVVEWVVKDLLRKRVARFADEGRR